MLAQPAPLSRSRRRPRAGGWLGVGGWVLLALPLLVFWWTWQHYAVNIPKWDDHALRAFLYYAGQEPTFWGKLQWLFKQHNEHRIVYDRLITALDYGLFGKLNYRHLMVVGNLSLVGLLAVFMGVLRRKDGLVWHRLPVLYAVPVALLLVNLSQWENMFWGMASLQNFSVVLWVLAAFYLLTYTNRRGLALLMAVLATLTSGNGLLVWPLGFLLLLLDPTVRSVTPKPKKLRPLLGWSVAALVVIGLYFWGFEKPGGTHAIRPGMFALLKGWLAVTGAAAEAIPIGNPLTNSILLGGLLMLITFGITAVTVFVHQRSIGRAVQALFRTDRRSNPIPIPPMTLFFWASAAFLLGTAAVVAYARTGFGADLLITSRYKLYSLTLLALLYVYAVTMLPGQLARWAGLAGGLGSLLLAWFSYTAFIDETVWWRHYQMTGQFNGLYTTNQPVSQIDAVTARYTDVAPAIYDKLLPIIYGPAQPDPATTVTHTDAGFTVSNATLLPADGRDAGAYLVARSATRTYLFPTWQNRAMSLASWFLPGRAFAPGFRADIATTELADAGLYQILVLVVPDAPANPYLLDTRQTITSTGNAAPAEAKNW